MKTGEIKSALEIGAIRFVIKDRVDSTGENSRLELYWKYLEYNLSGAIFMENESAYPTFWSDQVDSFLHVELPPFLAPNPLL